MKYLAIRGRKEGGEEGSCYATLSVVKGSRKSFSFFLLLSTFGCAFIIFTRVSSTYCSTGDAFVNWTTMKCRNGARERKLKHDVQHPPPP